ncbi:MAG: nucleotide pyrophosphohydrolase [Candidatus Verstraetearchaeota archaeon]|nr:nucleotide pyrophosphohydrolase [Candidatus Verstraetearchaeota archaeon]
MDLREMQEIIMKTYFAKDSRRGVLLTLAWFVEEVGELSKAVRTRDEGGLREEFADVLAWLLSLANLLKIDLEKVFIDKYGKGCPKCGAIPCVCAEV